MATKIIIKGQQTSLPGTYATIGSNIQNPPANLPYGQLLLIDDGIGAGWGGGSGIEGELNQGVDSIYSFDDLASAQAFLKGGPLWHLAEAAFLPADIGIQGVSRLHIIHARQTTRGSITYSLTNGTIVLSPKDEGLASNGTIVSGNLTQGYGCKLIAGPTSGKFILQIYHGSYKGIDPLNNTPYDQSVALSNPTLIVASPEVATLQELQAWMNSSSIVNAGFTFSIGIVPIVISPVVGVAPSSGTMSIGYIVNDGETYVVNVAGQPIYSFTKTPTETTENLIAAAIRAGITASASTNGGWTATGTGTQVILQGTVAMGDSYNGATCNITYPGGSSGSGIANGVTAVPGGTITTGPIVTNDVTNNLGFKPSVGATETYNAAMFQAALEAIQNLDAPSVVTLNPDPQSVNNSLLLEANKANLKYTRRMYVPGGSNKYEFETVSVAAAEYYDTDYVSVIHGRFTRNTRNGSRVYSQLYKACMIAGRISGLAPQVPVTLKSVNIDSEVHKLSLKEQERALSKGVMVTVSDAELGYHVVLQGINTIQNNEYLVDANTSHDLAVCRIVDQLNKELVIQGKRRFFSNPTSGPNRNTTSPQDVQTWTESYLRSRTATAQQDNLIIRVEDVAVTILGDTYKIEYSFVPNYPVNKIVFAGVMLEA